MAIDVLDAFLAACWDVLPLLVAVFAMGFVTVVGHELGHALAARALGVRVRRINVRFHLKQLSWSGSVQLSGAATNRTRAVVYAAGPAANAVMAAAAAAALLRADGLGFTLLGILAAVSLLAAVESLRVQTELDADGRIVEASDGYCLRELWRSRAAPGS
jgi:membrane-associated protease RseP (regulator of RpoE activity)